MTSEAEAVRSAVAALRQLGHTSMAYFGTPRIVHTPRPSYLTQAGSEHGVSAQLVFLADDADAETVAQHLEQVMQPPTNATAVLINYTFVGPLMNAIRSRGLRIPGDLSVLTFSDYEPTDAFLDPPLSSIHSDVTAVGKRTAETLVHWIESGIRPPLTSDLKLSSWHQTVSVGPVPVRVSGG
jgi:LacI family transcriptional regulator